MYMDVLTFNLIPLEQLPAMKVAETIHSGYSAIVRALRDASVIPIDKDGQSLLSLTRREFLLQMNQDLLAEEFNNEEIFRNFTEPALLTAKSRYYWNFARSRIFPLSNQVNLAIPSALSLKFKLTQKIEELLKIANDPAATLESKILLFSHLVIRSQLPKQHQLPGFDEFIDKLAAELEGKVFKGNLNGKSAEKIKPVYKTHVVEEYKHLSSSHLTVNAYTGLFGVILAVAVLYSIKNR